MGDAKSSDQDVERPLALVTGVGRSVGIAAAIAQRLADDGWDIAFTYWDAYEDRMPWGRDEPSHRRIAEGLRAAGARVESVAADLEDPRTPEQVFSRITQAIGPARALVLCHAESVDSGILDTTVESFDRHFAVNARANWLLIKAFAEQFSGPPGSGRIVALTSDHTAHNLPYGASKGALDRIVQAAAVELAPLGLTANAVNPGPIDTGWMTPQLADALRSETALGRLGTPKDTADLVAFLLSPAGGWITGQLLHSNGGFHLSV
jgi:3-oxoacyl-[acyl-carrier protein] reductase